MKRLLLLLILAVNVPAFAGEEQPKEGAVDPTVELAVSKVDEYFNKVTDIIDKYGGDAVDLGLNALRIEAASNVVVGLAWLIFFCVLVHTSRIFKKKYSDEFKKRKELNQSYATDDENMFCFLFCISVIFSILSGLAAFVYLIDIWDWVGLFYPEVYAVHKFLM